MLGKGFVLPALRGLLNWEEVRHLDNEMSDEQDNRESGNLVTRPWFRLKGSIAQHIRNKAIERARTRIYLHGKRPEDYEQDILEVIVKEEEDKIKSELKDKGILALLAALGLSFWT